jgi:hypothetical protein
VDEIDGWLIITAVGLLAVMGILQRRRLERLDTEVKFLRAWMRQADAAHAD